MKIRNREKILMLLAISTVMIVNSNVNMVFASNNISEEVVEYDDFIEEDYVLNNNYVVEDFSSADNGPKARTSVVLDAKKYGGLKGNGSNEAKNIQAMFDKAKREYSNSQVTIKFPAGTYCTNKKITVYSNMTVEGVTGKTFMKNTARQPVFINGKEGGAYKGNAGSNITIKNITFKNSRVMSMAHGKNITIENITVIDGPHNHAIEIAGSKNVVVKNSKFQGMNINDTSEFMKGRDFNEFIQIDKMAQAAFPHFGGYNSGDYQVANDGVTIEGCVFEPSKDHAYPVAIGTHGTFANDVVNAKGLVIKGCTFKGATKAAINFPGIGSMTIQNNKFSDMKNGIVYTSQMKKFQASELLIDKNTFTNVDNGIEVEMYKTSKALKKLSITNNTFTHKNSGTYAMNLKGTEKITSLTEKNNSVKNYKKAVSKGTTAANTPAVKSAEVEVKVSSAKVTVTSNKNSEVITTLKKGTKITVYDTGSNMWKTVKINGKTGYILTADVGAITQSSNSSSSSSKTTGTITGDGLRVRKGAGTNHAIVTKLYKGNKVTVLEGNKNGWTKISYGKYTGYVSSNYIKVNSSSSSSSSKTTGTITGDGLRVRKGAGTNHAIVTKLYKGNKVTILEGNKNGWTKISYGKYTGYVSSNYIKVN